MKRRETKPVRIGNIWVGGNHPVTVQSMTSTDTRDAAATVKQIKALTRAGCEIVRVAVPDEAAADAIKEIKKQIAIPLIADIHFDYRLAMIALKNGVDGLRLNPGNIKDKDKVKLVVKAAKDRQIPIRIGVNLGSVPYDLITKSNGNHAHAMVDCAMSHINILQDLNFEAIKISLKANDIETTVEAYKLMADKCNYPFHIGITEAGTEFSGNIKSAIGIGVLLHEGLGDTLRVSLTADPVKEIKSGWEILKALDIRHRGPQLVSCPTCGRCEINLIEVANQVEKRLKKYTKPIKVAVMGCVVNGPGESRMADIGIAGSKDKWILFKQGKVSGFVEPDMALDVLFHEIDKL